MDDNITQVCKYIPVRMLDGTVIKIESCSPVLDVAEALDFGEIADHIKDVAESIMLPIRDISPRKAEVDFGISILVENGKLVTVVSQGTSRANFKISLEWN